ncbi:MFS transporter [Nonomuraea sp. NPDC049400]|uniref:MFS transporter n=1 Tax=Nonomuraea sp. NPDC049400 TaxID=3364352 RepID=UPI0037933BD3
MFKGLFPLALATFAVGTDGFVIAGLLQPIAADLGVSLPAAGQLVTAFALTFALSAPVLGVATAGMSRRAALLIALGIFVIGNAATALGTTYAVVMTARVLTAAGAGIIGTAAFSVAAAIAPPHRRGRALALVMGGLTTATAIGLPLGTLIGRADWRTTLWAVAGLGLVAGAGIVLGVPPVRSPAVAFGDRLAPLKQGWVIGALAVTMITLAGIHTLYTYIGPALSNATDGSLTALTIVLLAWGVGTVIGNFLAGRLTDRYSSRRVLTLCLSVSVIVLLVGPSATAHLASTLVWAVLWGVCVGMPVIPQQHRLATHAPAAMPALLGLVSSAIYIGIALGGGIGGLAQQWITPPLLSLPAAAITALAPMPFSLASRWFVKVHRACGC